MFITRDNFFHFLWYFKFLRKIHPVLNKNFNFNNMDSVSDYIIFNGVKPIRKMKEKLNIGVFDFSFNKNILEVLKKFALRFLLYETWGSIIIFLSILILSSLKVLPPIIMPEFDPIAGEMFPVITFIRNNSIVLLLLITSFGFPITTLIYIIGIINNFYRLAKTIIDLILNNTDNKTDVKGFKFLIQYILYLIFAPVIFIFVPLVQIIVELLITFLYKQYVGFIWFIEICWLLINIISIVIITALFFIWMIIKYIFLGIWFFLKPIFTIKIKITK